MTEDDLEAQLRRAIDFKTKPRGALGALEDLAFQIGVVQGTVTPRLVDPTIIVFAADHGLAREAVSAYPRAVTAQMAFNFLAGGAGINVFCRQHDIAAFLVDSGVDWPGEAPVGLFGARVGPGTANCLQGDAMTEAQVGQCLDWGRTAVEEGCSPDSNIIGFGEIGIGNTSSAALLMSALLGLPIEDCAGPGSGLTGEGLERKITLLAAAQAAHARPEGPLEALAAFGGFEIAQMAGAMLAAWDRRALLLIDGFTATVAYLCAVLLNPDIAQGAIFSHLSDEPGHARLLAHLGASPLLALRLRLGEGSGCAVAYPIVASACAFLDDMASFEDAGVSTGVPETT